MTPELALMDAVKAHLLANAAVSAIVDEKVLDEVPADRSPVKPPYLYIGPINRRRVADTPATAWAMRMRLYAVSVGFGRRQAWEITHAASRALVDTDLEISGGFFSVDPVTVTEAGDVINPPNVKAAFLDITVIIQEMN